MDLDEVRSAIESAWDRRDALDADGSDSIRSEIDWTIAALDAGELRVADKRSDEWVGGQPVGEEGGDAVVRHQRHGVGRRWTW